MFRSMTAYCRKCVEVENQKRTVTVEIRSVNNRYLDLGVKLPKVLAAYEARVRSVVTGAGVNRGKVDMIITVARMWEGKAAAAPPMKLDHDAAEAYISLLSELRDRFGLADDITVTKVAAAPGIIVPAVADDENEAEEEWAAVEPVLSAALEEFVASRTREGENLRADIAGKLEKISSLVDRIEWMSEESSASLREKITARIRALTAEAGIEPDEGRILTECAIAADRLAIDEELVRLRSHLSALRAMMAETVPVGRKFDFQLQEVNREINTICSKCQNAAIASVGVELKNETEKVREQIQNIE